MQTYQQGLQKIKPVHFNLCLNPIKANQAPSCIKYQVT